MLRRLYIASCIADINNWLRFNPSKTEIMWLGARHLLQQVDISAIQVLYPVVSVVQSARDFGVILDSQLSLSLSLSLKQKQTLIIPKMETSVYCCNHRSFYGERGARAYNGGLGAMPPAGSRGRAPGQEVRGAPLKLKAFYSSAAPN